jgi:nucleotide-binding universal stress UspA family protein
MSGADKNNRTINFRRILFMTDFSRVSAMSLPYAAAFARRFAATLLVLHVISPESHTQSPGEKRDEVFEEQRRQAGERIRALLAGPSFDGIRHEVLVERGDIWPVMSTVAEKQNVDLIVIGTHGRHGLQKLLAGSLAEEISELALCPVLLAGPEVSAVSEAALRIERILYATDFSQESRRAMDYAYELARTYAAHLVFLHVAEDVAAEPLSTRMPAEVFFRARFLEKHWPQAEEGIQPEFVVEFGSPEAITLEIAQERKVQLIVLGKPRTDHPQLVAHLPGPLAYNVMSHARCPVLLVPSAPESAALHVGLKHAAER